jgi:tagatose-6-phosphate ketose/aldose isomerase
MGSILGFTQDDIKKRNMENTICEINRQPATWRAVYNKVLSKKSEIKNFLKEFDRNTRVIFTGAGSSGFIGDSLAPLLRKEQLFNSVESIHTTDIVSHPEMYLKNEVKTLLVSFGRSGNSPESIAAIETATKVVTDIYHLIFTCNPEGKLASYRNERVLSLILEEINDDGFAMTSSVTGMMLAAYSVFNIDRALYDEVQIISDYAESIIANNYDVLWDSIEPKLDRLVVLGSGNLLGAAKESALKSIELTAGKLTAWYDTPMGFRHGPKSLLTQNTIILYFVSNNLYTRKYDLDMLMELSHSLRKQLIVVSDQFYPEVENYSDVYLYNSTNKLLQEAFTPYIPIVAAQILALFSSIKLGCTPDNPFPNGEVNRVVKGVTIYDF